MAYQCKKCSKTSQFAEYQGSVIHQNQVGSWVVTGNVMGTTNGSSTTVRVISKPYCPYCGEDWTMNPPEEVEAKSH